MTVTTWMLLPIVTTVFFAAMLHCQSQSDEYQEEFSNGLFCTPICQGDDWLQGETFHCVLSNEGNDYKFIARNPEGEKWRFYRTDLDYDSDLLCQIGENGDKFAISKSRRKCSGLRKSRNSNENTGYDFIPNVMRQVLVSKKPEQSDSSVPVSRKSNLAVSASGPGSYALASDGKESLFANGDKRPSAQTSGNAHAFSSDGKTNAESHFGNDYTYSATGRPTAPPGRPNDEPMPPFFNLFQQQRPPYPVFVNDRPPNKPNTNYPQQSFGPSSHPFDNVFGSVGLANPFLMLSGQPQIYSGKRNLPPGQNPGLYQPPSVDSIFRLNNYDDYAVAFLPYMGPYMPHYEAPRGFRGCYPRCKREAIDSASEEVKSEENTSILEAELSDEICTKTEAEICRKKRIMYCKEDEDCCWENVDFDACNDGQSDLSTECYRRLSTILGLY